MGRPLPFSSVKPKKGDEAYGFYEYIFSGQGPIPVSEALKDIHDSMKEKGMSDPDIESILWGIATGAVSGESRYDGKREEREEEKGGEPEVRKTHDRARSGRQEQLLLHAGRGWGGDEGRECSNKRERFAGGVWRIGSLFDRDGSRNALAVGESSIEQAGPGSAGGECA